VWFNPEGRLLAWVENPTQLQTASGTIGWWDVAAGRPFAGPRWPLAMHGEACAFLFEDQSAAFIGTSTSVEVWNIAENRRSDLLVRPSKPAQAMPNSATVAQPGLALSADGTCLARAAPRITIWNVKARQWMLSLPPERSRVFSFAWSPDGELLAVGSADGSVVLWNLPIVRRQLAEMGLAW
jgi:WD40 repeat protein